MTACNTFSALLQKDSTGLSAMYYCISWEYLEIICLQVLCYLWESIEVEKIQGLCQKDQIDIWIYPL